MKKAISLNLKTWVLLSLTMFVGGTFIGCQEEVDQSNRFTFKGEVIATHLENNPEKYSHFVEILNKASIGVKSEGTLFKTLSTYGAYTCFAPTNEAVEKFVQEQYNIYKTSVENNAIAPDKYPIIETGITSPNVSDLSEEKCTEIARNHVIEDEFKTVDFSAGFSLPKTSMSYRTILTNTDIVDNKRVYYVGINNSEIIEPDIATYNGTVHSIAEVINPSTDNAAEIPDSLRVVLVKKGADVKVQDFGNEGSGGQSFMHYDWKAGERCRFLMGIRPDKKGNTVYTAYFYDNNKGKWSLVASFRRPKITTWYTNAHSFLENFNPVMGYINRKAYYSNQWARTTDGRWIPVTKARFTCDATGHQEMRLDYTGGSDGEKFFLSMGGFFDEYTNSGTHFERAGNTTEAPKIDFSKLE